MVGNWARLSKDLVAMNATTIVQEEDENEADMGWDEDMEGDDDGEGDMSGDGGGDDDMDDGDDDGDLKNDLTSALGDDSWENTIDGDGDEDGQFNFDDWGAGHPYRARKCKPGIRVPFSKAETQYITKWMRRFPNLGVPALYQQLLNSDVARNIFHAHHVEKQDRIAYIYKSIRKQLGTAGYS